MSRGPVAEADWDLPDFARIRLFTEENLGPSRLIELAGPASHYLLGVMRRRVGDTIRLFNGRDGEWNATIAEISRKTVRIAVGAQTRAQVEAAGATLLFAPIKKGPLGFLVEKATELGAARLQPVVTARTQAHINVERLRLHAIEAAEQSWRLTVPEVAAPKALDATLETWPADAPLLYCDERRRARPMLQALKGRDDLRGCAWSILIGPEGGFTAQEQAALDAVAAAIPVSLGPRIVRAETAAVMALTLWQSVLGDLGK